MRCSICNRPLLHCAVPGIAIGPTCAAKRGLAPERSPRVRLFDIRATQPDTHQVDWVNLINAGLLAGDAGRAVP
jgi:hypothetical protein